jgi:cellulose synthase/poly-beta-1,6-N-acetylglucosamine synthase-like glycosyltransferase
VFLIYLLLTGWLAMVAIQLIFILLSYTRTAFHRSKPAITFGQALPGVTVVVCAWNELDNLRQLIPLLAAQQYPTYEVLIMDDRSTDGTEAFLRETLPGFLNVRTIRVNQVHDHVTAKKYALTIALKKAAYPVVLLTDADCRPASTDWLSGMVGLLNNPQKSLVLGFSPYNQEPGFLNFLIRSETLFTAVQYFSLALAGFPYMGVGRNLLYRTSLFFDNKGFHNHLTVLGGDDDLFVNEVATAKNTTVCLDPATFTWSEPKHTWEDWRHQKRRHLNVGKFYKPGHKIRLALLMGSHVLTWLLGLVVGGMVIWWCVSGQSAWLMEPILLVATGLFALRWLLFWGVVGRISYRLAHTVHWAAVPFMDVLLGGYYGIMGSTTLFSKRKKIMTWR